jgi:hypothetical protein
MIRRRTVIASFGRAVVARPLAAAAQATPQRTLIGYITSLSFHTGAAHVSDPNFNSPSGAHATRKLLGKLRRVPALSLVGFRHGRLAVLGDQSEHG